MKHLINKKEGIISISSKGTGYVAIGAEKNKGEDPEIDAKHLNTALHGDLVEIILHPKGNTRQTAEVSKIITRAKMRFAGVLESENGMLFLKPDDTKMYTDILIPEKFLNGAKANQKVFVEIVSWVDAKKAPEGKVVKILGRPGDNDTEMHAIAMEKGFAHELPMKVDDEARKIKAHGIHENDYVGRRDFRKIFTFTIDPSDAKDFDDAISFKEISEGVYEVGIHIADVSHYVKVGSPLDEEARERGTSVYLVDRTIPMLPEALSNNICSLMPEVERLAFAAVFEMDIAGNIKNEWFGRTIIKSDKRFSYEEVQDVLDAKSDSPHKEFLFNLRDIARGLRQKKLDAGAVTFEDSEVKFVLDEENRP
ncbi:MAG: Ribonuclease R, partial [Candidatus Nomurabacteria bacterium GW2011_GWA1_40_8]